jgi:hypothetical protein
VKGFNVCIQLVTFSLSGLAFILVEAWCNVCGNIKAGVMKAIRHLEYSGIQ